MLLSTKSQTLRLKRVESIIVYLYILIKLFSVVSLVLLHGMHAARYKNTTTQLSSYISYALVSLHRLQSYPVPMSMMLDSLHLDLCLLIFIYIGSGIGIILKFLTT